VWITIGVPLISKNCLEGAPFLPAGAMRVPRPAAGMMTVTFIGEKSIATLAASGFRVDRNRKFLAHAAELGRDDGDFASGEMVSSPGSTSRSAHSIRRVPS
jgi:hypothetical protein